MHATDTTYKHDSHLEYWVEKPVMFMILSYSMSE